MLPAFSERKTEIGESATLTVRLGVTEIFAHPVNDGEELRGYDKANADIRVHDAACLLDPAVAALLDQHHVKCISYRQLRDLQRSS
jgi:hypothetical protein